jgi:flagellar biosynthesis/type III secretory pathway M-ring protein FliF/YscJ
MDHHMAAAAPPGFLDYLIVAGAVIVFLVALWIFVRGLVRPGEKEPDHIKRKVLDDHVRPGR